MMQVRQLTESARHHASVDDCTRHGVEVVEGEARLSSPWTVEVEGRTLTTGRSSLPLEAGRGYRRSPVWTQSSLTCDTLLQLHERPDRLLILGGGAGACEFAQLFQRMGSRVTVASPDERLLDREDAEAAQALTAALIAAGIDLRLGLTAQRVESTGSEHRLICRAGEGEEQSLPFDRLLLMLGQYADVEGWGWTS